VPGAHHVCQAALLQALQGELAQGLKHREPRLSGEHPLRSQQTLLDERRDPLEHVPDPVAIADRFRPVQGEAAGEHGQPLEKLALVVSEQVVAPGDGAAQGPLTLRKVSRPSREQRQPAVQLVEDRFRGQ
jgi:hypothetical protein